MADSAQSQLQQPTAFDRDAVARAAASLAERGVYIGTSSWKYAGWCGQLYDREKYITRGKFAESRFERECLAEYATVFKTVCVDAVYYRFPDFKYLVGMMSQVPSDFNFAFKVTDEITVKKFPKLARFGDRAGKPNDHFLNADLFEGAFVKVFESFPHKVGLFIFEFSRFYPTDYEHGRDFIADLDRFLTGIPPGWPYGVEMRNKNWLRPDYFEVLRKHNVAHVFNSWSEMPPVTEQMSLQGSRTSPNLSAARFLLKPGRKFDDAVKLFSPYVHIKDPYPDAHAAAAALINETLARATPSSQPATSGLQNTGSPMRIPTRPFVTYIFVNNRLEGNALETIARILEQVRGLKS
jgi:uncharacterized protein YecE (DUF72 family)